VIGALGIVARISSPTRHGGLALENRAGILVSESHEFSYEAAELLRQSGELILSDLDRSSLLSAVRDIDVLWIRLRHRIDAEVMAAAPRLKIIVTPTTGLNHVDVDEAERRGIRVLSLRGEDEFLRDVRATAEHTVALMLSLLRHIPAALAHVQEGSWNREQFKGRELYGKTVGVVGYGRLGRIVGKYLRAFGTRVLVTDPKLDRDSVEPGITFLSLNQLVREADIVTLHVNLCDETRGFFGSRQFSMMKQGACFINTSRGELVDEATLLDALGSGRLAGAALDVVSGEYSGTMTNHPLVAYAREHDNVIITPHIGGCTVESMKKTELFLASRLAHLLRGDTDLIDSRSSHGSSQ
jgi:D-3-phosphoglycerate dehydrogenase